MNATPSTTDLYPTHSMSHDELVEEAIIEREYQRHLATTDRISAELDTILAAPASVQAAMVLLAYRLEVAQLTERAAHDLEDAGVSGEDMMGIARRLREG